MTQNQISYAKVAEDKRHNEEMEKLTKAQNKLTKTQVEAQKAHYERSDAYTDAHYQRSDAAAMTSANANAMNAVTNRKQYEMAYDIEYGWTGDLGYPTGMPLSAQRKNAELAIMTDKYPEEKRQLEAQTEQIIANTEKAKAETDESKTKSVNNVLNGLFGRTGLYGAIETMVFGPKSTSKR